MPAVSKAQQALMGADLARAREGKPTRTGMTVAQLRHFASTPRKGLPARAHALANKAASARKSRRKSASAASRSVAATKSAYSR